MSKIVNNVSIVCNNVIFKYLEEDIVLSLNARTLTFTSVDSNWQPAFTGPYFYYHIQLQYWLKKSELSSFIDLHDGDDQKVLWCWFFFMVSGLLERVVCLVVDWRLNLFSELAPPELMLRKLVSVTDLTICLDQCNAQGKIPIYQVNLMILWDSLRCLQEGLKISGAD